ncbi:MAG: acetyltransferase [SAR324 cluster bacterium]|nr:acetyltransferase [SAR324 cluster bacterium]
MHYDVFNGDADGICALHQLRMADPLESMLVTGVKRDIKLLQKLIEVSNSTITVLDISMDANKRSLLELLKQKNAIQYFDHHFPGEVPIHSGLQSHIDTAPDVCTSVIVDRFLNGKYREWAIVAAFGDNLHKAAHELASSLSLSSVQIEQLCELGELINYNSYGPKIEDLHCPPTILYGSISAYPVPWGFCEDSKTFLDLKTGYAQDMENVKSYSPIIDSTAGSVYCFPAEPWSLRVAGVFSNSIARDQPESAHALLVANGDGSYLVSVRSPLNNPTGADVLCREFATGGGRKAAAGINQLPDADVEKFFERFESVFTNDPDVK